MLQEKDIGIVKELYEELRNRKKLAEVFGVTENQIKGFIRKHRINIYTFGEKRKIIPKEELETMYKTLTIKQIANKIGVSKDTVSSWFKYYDISIDTSSGKNIILTFEEKEILTGLMLGDGHLTSDGILSITHSEKQYDYLIWKLQKLTRFFKGNIYKRVHPNGNVTYSSRSFVLSELKDWRLSWYKNGCIGLPEKWDTYFTPLALAVLYMDDGSKHSETSGFIHTMSFTLEEVKLICESMKERFGLLVYPIEINKTRQPGQYSIYFPSKKEVFKRLREVIEFYVCDCMKYKLSQSVTTKREAPKRLKFKRMEKI